MFIDGIEVDSKITDKSFNKETINAGAHSDTTSVFSFWNGQMNQIRVYKRALTANEISDNYNNTKDDYTP